MLKKKRMFVSKHNIFVSVAKPSRPKLAKRGSEDPNEKKLREATAVLHKKSEDPLLHLTSLDYLGEDDDLVESNEDSNSSLGADREKILERPHSIQKLSYQDKKGANTPAAPIISHKETSIRHGVSPSKRPVLRTPRNVVESMEDTKFNGEISSLLQGLHGELKYYEELSGRRSVFDATVIILSLLYEIQCGFNFTPICSGTGKFSQII